MRRPSPIKQPGRRTMVLHQSKPFEIIIIRRHIGDILMRPTPEFAYYIILGNARFNRNPLILAART